MTEKKQRQDYPNKIEWFRENGWKSYEDCADVVTFWCKKSHGQKYDINGKVFKPPETHFDKVCKVNDAMALLQDKLFTKRLTRTSSGKKVRSTYSKVFLDTPECLYYDYLALMHYFRQVVAEGKETCILSYKEWVMLQPVETKKAKKKREQDKVLRSKLVNY